jgi:hypothetical protein
MVSFWEWGFRWLSWGIYRGFCFLAKGRLFVVCPLLLRFIRETCRLLFFVRSTRGDLLKGRVFR